MPRGYYVEADGTVRTVKSVEKEIEENSEQKKKQAGFKMPVKTAVVLCPFCKTPVAQERYSAHVRTHAQEKTVKETKGIVEEERGAARGGRRYRPYGRRRIREQPGTGLNFSSGSSKATSLTNRCPYCKKEFFSASADSYSSHLEKEREKAIAVFLSRYSVRSNDLHETVLKFREGLRNALVFWESNPAGNSPESAMRFAVYGGVRKTWQKKKKAKPAKPEKLFINACPYCGVYFYHKGAKAAYERHLKNETSLVTWAKNKHIDALTMYWRRNAELLKEYMDANGRLFPYIEKLIAEALAKRESKEKDSTPQELLDSLPQESILRQAKAEREQDDKKLLSQRQFLYEYFSGKKPGFKANITDMTEQWKASSGYEGGIKKVSWIYLEIFLAKHGLKSETSRGYITLESTVKQEETTMKSNVAPASLSGLKNRAASRKTGATDKNRSIKTGRREKVFSSIYTATIADITGRDTGYANKGDYRFREAGRFGSTPLYDDYDN